MEIHHVFIRASSLLTFSYILRLIYAHKLRVGHSWFLFLFGAGFFVLSVWPNAIDLVTVITGTRSWLTNILFFLMFFLFIIIVHCSIMISALTDRVKELGQQLAILNCAMDKQNFAIDQSEPQRQPDGVMIHIPLSSKQA